MNLNEKSVAELRNIAKELGISNISKMKKSELIEAISNTENKSSKLEDEKKAEKEKVDEAVAVKEDNSSNEVSDENGRYNLTSDTDKYVEGILELLPDGYGFLRGDNYLSTSKDVYVSPIQIKRFRLDTGDKIKGIMRIPQEENKFPALIYVGEVNRATS